MVTAAPAMPQTHSLSATTVMATYIIPEDPTIKGIFAAASAQIQAPAVAAPRSTDTIIVEVPIYQVSILYKMGSTIFDKGSNSNSMSVVTLAPHTPDQCRAGRYYGSNPGGEVNSPYLLTIGDIKCGTISNDNDDETDPEDLPPSVMSVFTCYCGSIIEMLNPPIHLMEAEKTSMNLMSPTT